MNPKLIVNNFLNRLTGYHFAKPYSLNKDARLSDIEKEIYLKVQQRTMTNANSIANLIAAAKYVNDRQVPGAFVECGVWRGGSAMAYCYSNLEQNVVDREVFLLDTYQGYSNVNENDFEISNGRRAQDLFKEDANYFCSADLDDVQRGITETGYPVEKVHYLVGDVVDTDLILLPKQISILRLDTDYYDSTKWELENLYHRLTPGGVLIIDDYDHWNGCRKACDEFFKNNNGSLLIQMEYGRIMIKHG